MILLLNILAVYVLLMVVGYATDVKLHGEPSFEIKHYWVYGIVGVAIIVVAVYYYVRLLIRKFINFNEYK